MNKLLDNKVISLIISFLVGGIVMYFFLCLTPIGSNYKVIKDTTKIVEKTSLSKSISKVYDAVVLIQVYSNDTVTNNGSGFIYKTDKKYAYILTNEHVITGSNDIKVTLTSDEVTNATLLGKDKYLDLAVLRIEKKYAKQVVTIGSSKKMNLGDVVFTVGSPIGTSYRGSVTSGILSGKDRKVSVELNEKNENDFIMRVLQVDAAINPGNSGGPLLNVNGEVIGICSLKLVDDDVEGMGFAIPIEYATSHIDSLEKGNKIKWPSLGIDITNIANSSKLLSNDITIPTNINEGVVILKVKEKSSAYKGGLKKGDIIIKVDDVKVKDTANLRYELYAHKAGERVKITIIRNSKEKNKTILLDEK